MSQCRPALLLARRSLLAQTKKKNSSIKMKKFLRKLAFLSPFAAVPAMAEYTVPAGVTTAITDAKAAAEGLANAAIPGVAAIALSFVGLVVVWLIVKAIRRGAK